MSCLFLTYPFYSAVNAVESVESNSKKENMNSTILKFGGATLGAIGMTVLACLLCNKFLNSENNTDSDVFEQNFLEFKGTKKHGRSFFADPQQNTSALMQKINLLKKHVIVAQKSVVDKDFLRQIGSNGDTVIVNAANRWGVGGAGVCGAIFAEMKVGQTVPEVEAWKKRTERNEIGTGNVYIHSSNGIENAKCVMQTVGPNFGEFNHMCDAYEKLYEAYFNTIILAALKGMKNIVMPALSLGIYAKDAKENPEKLGECTSIIALTAIADALSTLKSWQIQGVKVYLCDFKSQGAAEIFFDKSKKLLNS